MPIPRSRWLPLGSSSGLNQPSRRVRRNGVHSMYPWHPWSGRFVHVHEALSKGTHIFRCSLSGSSSGRHLEVPAWMFDRSLSGYWRSLPVPHVDLAALHVLAKLLDDADTSSQSGGMSAALISHEASRRDVHAKSTHDISVRSILEPAPKGDSRNAAMAGVAGGDPSSADGAHRTAIHRSRKLPARLPAKGGRS
ncbi:hypothetical protein GGQ79_005020 [Ochrobactrum pecoris]|uniref:Uncharacterized protein n=1 Tax=Brucella pecoris TaxID=867683 RepID=A0AB34YZC2_9HYPH|nr:hypothetical protein [Brucella pecoris]